MSSGIASRAVLELVWTPCSVCWGQRRIFIEAAEGEGYVPISCSLCLGVGDVLTGAP